MGEVYGEAWSKEDNALLLDSMSSILIALDARARVRLWNAQAEAWLCIPASRAIGSTLDDLPLPIDPSILRAAVRSSLERRTDARLDELSYRRSDDTTGFLGLTVSPILARDESLRGCLILGRDITERRLLEDRLARASKLESIGQLAAGIAHEINTPTQYVSDNTIFLRDSFQQLLSALGGYRQLLAASPPSEPASRHEAVDALERGLDLEYLGAEVPRALEEALEGLGRISTIVKAMKNFSHPSNGAFGQADLNAAIQSTITVARNEWKYVAEVELDLDQAMPAVTCIEDEFNQVVLNMLVNAAHAIESRLSAAGTPRGSKGRIRISTHAAGEQAEIRIQDSGTGMPPHVVTRIFDPFFTTKAVGKGTGQGLAIAHQVIVVKHGGTIDVETTPGSGTTFVIRLPLRQADGAVGAPRPDDGAPPYYRPASAST